MTPQSSSFAELPKKQRFWILCLAGGFIVVAGILAPKIFVPAETSKSGATPAEVDSRKSDKSKAISNPTASTNPPVLTDGQGPTFGELLSRLLMGTVVVVILCAGTAYLVAKRAKGNVKKQEGPMSVSGVLSVGRGAVYLVRVGDEQLLAAVDATGLKSLIHLASTEVIEEDPPQTLNWPPQTVPTEAPIIQSARVSVTAHRFNEFLKATP